MTLIIIISFDPLQFFHIILHQTEPTCNVEKIRGVGASCLRLVRT